MFIHIVPSSSDCSKDIISSILSCERRKKGKVVANWNAFGWFLCVMNQLAQVPVFVKCLKQEMIACVARRNSDEMRARYLT